MSFEDDVRDLVAQYDPMMTIPERDLLTWLRDRLAMPVADEDLWSASDCERAEEEIAMLSEKVEQLEAQLHELSDLREEVGLLRAEAKHAR